MSNSRIFRVIDYGVHQYSMIEKGDRILLGLSGGKDSAVLAEYFAMRLKRSQANNGIPFKVSALHIATEIHPQLNENIKQKMEQWQIPLYTKEFSVLARLKSNQKMNCWWCASQRRTDLLDYALKNQFNKIALGHHMDDILETLIMNILNKSELSTMIPRLQYNQYPVCIIRPLCFVDAKMIIRHAEKQTYTPVVCTCVYQNNSLRKIANKKLEAFTNGSYDTKRKLFNALRNINPEYLP